MDRLDAMRVLLRVAELGSFTRAADELQLPRATVTHTIQALEQHLGVRLLNRTTRHVSATPDGEDFLQHCRQLLAGWHEMEEAFRGGQDGPRGKLRVDLQGSLAQHFLLPRLGEFLSRHPHVQLDIGLGERLVDLVRERVDCVLRSGPSPDSSLVARRVAVLPQLTCASPAYLARHGVPADPAHLDGHQAVNFASGTGRLHPFEFLQDGRLITLALPGRVTVSSAEAYVQCCEAGAGLIQLPRYHVEEALEAGRLVEVLPDHAPPARTVSVMYPQHREASSALRAFIEWVAECLAPLRDGPPEHALIAKRTKPAMKSPEAKPKRRVTESARTRNQSSTAPSA